MNKEKYKVGGYGDVLSIGLEKKLLFYAEYGSYQGDYLAILEGKDSVYLHKGYYGSCCGCDWLEAERCWEDGTLTKKQIENYCKDEKPFLEIKKTSLDILIKSKNMKVYFPKNTRLDYNDFNWDDIKKSLIEARNNLI